jgi:serine/threonine protein kinase
VAERAFGPYRLIEQLAVGGMAEIYLAQTRGIGGFEKFLALKVIHPNFAEDEHFIKMLVDEAKIAVQLQHVNIAQIFDLGRIGNTYFIAMEFVDGCDLFHALKRSSDDDVTVPIELGAYIAQEVCAALDYAHNKKDDFGRPLGIIHRDISPQNVLLSYAGEVKLVDFGIAKATQRRQQTAAGVIKGKYYYMSPEQAWGDPIDQRTDIFSTGILLYEMLVGQMLYLEEDMTILLDKVRKADIPPPSTLRRDVPRDLEAIVMRALARRPDQRFASAHELGMALERFLFSYAPDVSSARLASFLDRVVGAERERLDQMLPRRNATREVISRDEYEPPREHSVLFKPADLADRKPPRAPTPRPADQSTLAAAPTDFDDDGTIVSGPPVFLGAESAGADDEEDDDDRPTDVVDLSGVPPGDPTTPPPVPTTRPPAPSARRLPGVEVPSAAARAGAPASRSPLPQPPLRSTGAGGAAAPPRPSARPAGSSAPGLAGRSSGPTPRGPAVSPATSEGRPAPRPAAASESRSSPRPAAASESRSSPRPAAASESRASLRPAAASESRASPRPAAASAPAIAAERSGAGARKEPAAAPRATAPTAGATQSPLAPPAAPLRSALDQGQLIAERAPEREPGGPQDATDTATLPHGRPSPAPAAPPEAIVQSVLPGVMRLSSAFGADESRLPPPAPSAPLLPPLAPSRGRARLAWAAIAGALAATAVALVALRGSTDAKALHGTLKIVSVPPGAALRLDGVALAKRTPIALENIDRQKAHRLEVSLDGYQTKTETVEREEEVIVVLQADVGTLRLSSDPAGAEVYLDNHPAGVTPLVVDLPFARSIELELRLRGYRAYREVLDWQGARELVRKISLRRSR